MAEPKNVPNIADFTRDAKVQPETQLAFSKFMEAADPLAVAENAKAASTADPQKDPAAAEAQLEEAIRQVEKTPEKTYQERLKEHNISLEEARKIVDTIMTKGVYTRSYRITSTTSVTFRSRGFNDQERVQNELEGREPQFIGTVNMIMAKYNLAASLVELAGRKFEEKDFDKTLAFVERLPHVLFNVLVMKLSMFDELVLTVMDEGAIENF